VLFITQSLQNNAQNLLHTLPRNFPVDGNVVASWQQVVVMEFGKRHDATDTTDFCPRQLVTDLLQTCYEETGVMHFGLNRSLHAEGSLIVSSQVRFYKSFCNFFLISPLRVINRCYSGFSVSGRVVFSNVLLTFSCCLWDYELLRKLRDVLGVQTSLSVPVCK